MNYPNPDLAEGGERLHQSSLQALTNDHALALVLV